MGVAIVSLLASALIFKRTFPLFKTLTLAGTVYTYPDMHNERRAYWRAAKTDA